MTTVRKWFIVAGGALVALGLSAHVARASYVSSDPRLPSPTYRLTFPVIYVTVAGQYHIDSFFDIFVDLTRVMGPPPGGTEVHSFFDVFTELSLQQPGAASSLRESPSRQTIQMTRPSSMPFFDTEMLQLDLSGGGMGNDLPAGVKVRESPTMASTGKTSITDMGGGMYHINSFFDIFTELSIDGGQTWNPGTVMHLEGDVPEPSTLTLIGLGLFAGTATAMRRARRGR